MIRPFSRASALAALLAFGVPLARVSAKPRPPPPAALPPVTASAPVTATATATAPPGPAASVPASAPAAVSALPAASSPASSSPASSSPAAAPAASGSAAPGPPVVRAGQGGPINQRATTWDLTVEGGYGKELKDGGEGLFWGRLRAGILFVREPQYLMLGLTADVANRQRLALGLQGQIVDVTSGLWLQVGPAIDTKGHLGGSVAVGFASFGVEAQRRTVEGLGEATILLGKLSIPIGVVAYAVAH